MVVCNCENGPRAILDGQVEVVIDAFPIQM